jgi:hypothetical protein
MLAVVTYRDPESPVALDVERLQANGWRHVPLDQLASAAIRESTRERFFHLALEDDVWRDAAITQALSAMSCEYTVFASVGGIDTAARQQLRTLESARPGTVQDGSACRSYQPHFRKVLHFHSNLGGRLPPAGLAPPSEGDPVFLGGSDLVCARFDVDRAVVDHCHAIAADFRGERGSLKWLETMKHSLRAKRLGWDQFGPWRKSYINWSRARFCVRGEYESRPQFRQRVAQTLQEGRKLLQSVTGTRPCAFAHPWSEPAIFADRCLADLGYIHVFSNSRIPRIVIDSRTPRPLNLSSLSTTQPSGTPGYFLRRLLYA